MKKIAYLLTLGELKNLFLNANILILIMFVLLINFFNTLTIGILAFFIVINIIISILNPPSIPIKKFKWVIWAKKVKFGKNISLIIISIIALSMILLNYSVFGLALAEEIIFRWIPMLLVVIIANIVTKTFKTNKQKTEKIMIIFVLIISSLLFGFVHNGLITIGIQGFNGACMFALYLRPFFMRSRSEKIWKWQLIPLLYSTTLHSLYNIISYFMI